MKRYDAWSEPDPQIGFGGGRCELYERTLGQYVTFDDHEREVSALRAELARVKAESLRVVPDGEAYSMEDVDIWRCVDNMLGLYMYEKELLLCDDETSLATPVRIERWEDE